ncbi:hypothetical protein D9M68_932790 [compost metagenome]
MFFQGDLLEGIIVHKVITQLVFIEVLESPSFDPGGGYFFTGGEGVFKDTSGFDVFELGTHKCASFSGLYMLKFYYREKVIVPFQGQSVSEVCCCCHLYFSIFSLIPTVKVSSFNRA